MDFNAAVASESEELFSLAIDGPVKVVQGEKFKLKTYPEGLNGGKPGNVEYNWFFKNKKIKTSSEIELMFKDPGSYELKVEASKKKKNELDTAEVVSSKIFSIAVFQDASRSGTNEIKYNEIESINFINDGSSEIEMKSGVKISVSDKYSKNSEFKAAQIYNFENLETDESYVLKLNSAVAITDSTIEIGFDEKDADEIHAFAVLPETGYHVPLSFNIRKISGDVLISVPVGSKSINGAVLFNSSGPFNFNNHIIAVTYGDAFQTLETRKIFAFDETAAVTLKSGSNFEFKNGAKIPSEIIITEGKSKLVNYAPEQKIFTVKSSGFIKDAALKIKLNQNFNEKYVTAVYAVPNGDTVFLKPSFDTAEGLITINVTGGKRKFDINNMQKKRSKGGSNSGPGNNAAGAAANAGNDETIDFEAGAVFIIETGGDPKTIPASALMELPYYEQGSSGCCWAAAALMFIKSYLPQAYSDTAIYEILRGMRLNKDDGIGGAWSSDMKRLGARIKGYTGQKTETLTFFNYRNFINYTLAKIAENKPVIVNMGLHQGMFVGYEMNGSELNQINIIYHDPQNSNEKTPAQGPYRKISAEKLCAEFTPAFAKSINITICAENPVDTSKKILQTFHLPDSLEGNILSPVSGGAGTIKYYGKRKIVADYITWDIAAQAGYKFKAFPEQPQVDEFVINTVSVWNSDRKKDAECILKTYIKRVKNGYASGPAILETGEVKITIPKFDPSVSIDGTGNHPSRFLYRNFLRLSDMAPKLNSDDNEFSFINELLDKSGNLLGIFSVNFNYKPLILTPVKLEKMAVGQTAAFKAEIGGDKAICDFKVSDSENFSIDENGVLKFLKEPVNYPEKIFVTAVEKNNNPPVIILGSDKIKLLKMATAEVILSKPAVKIEKLEIVPAEVDIVPEGKIQFKALADGVETAEIEWKVTKGPSVLCEPGKGSQLIDYHDIAVAGSEQWGNVSSSGLYEAPVKVPETDLEVLAIFKAEPSKICAAKVRFVPFKIQIDDNRVEIEQSKKYEVEISTYAVLPENYSIKYDFGDGTPVETTQKSRLEHKFEKIGTFNIKTGLYDGSGKLVIEDSKKITVKAAGVKIYKTYYPEDDSSGNPILKEEYEGYEKDGKVYKHGKFRTYSKTGKLTGEGGYVNDSREGQWSVYSRKSAGDEYYLSFVYLRKNDIREGKSMSYYPDGTKKEEVTWANDRPNGPFVKYYENGKKYEEGTYLDSYKEGHFIKWYDSGQKAEEGEYKGRSGAFEKRFGTWTYWRKNGSVKEKAVYEDDRVKEYIINNNSW